MKIKQAVIPAAGLGTRFLPTTKCLPKELIPLVDKPCIQHVVEEALDAGVEEIIFVVSEKKKSIENYFRPDDALYSYLDARGEGQWVQSMRDLENRASYRFVIQSEPLGLGHAVWCARDAIKEDHFFVILPDDIIVSETTVCEQMRAIFAESQKPLLTAMQVAWHEVNRYGILKALPLSDRVGDVQDIVEKPKREEAPSNLAVIGRYLLSRDIFAILEKTEPGAGGEIQLTDALRHLVTNGGLYSYSFVGERFDTGVPLGWLQANVALGLQNPTMKEELIKTMKSLSTLYL